MTMLTEDIANNVLSATVKHPQYKQALEVFNLLMRSSPNIRKKQGLFLVGPSGSGKTCLAETMASLYPVIEESERTRIRVIHISMPACPTIVAVCKLILTMLGQRYSRNATEDDLTAQLKAILINTGAMMLIIDEAQHLVEGNKINKKPAHVADWLKQLMNDVHISITLIGIPSIEILMDANEQFRSRFLRKIRLKGFKTKTKSDVALFSSVVGKLIQQSGFDGNCEYIRMPSALEMLYYATNGRIGYISIILGESLGLASNEKSRTLKREHFETAFVSTIWADATAKTNPFSGEFTPRELVKRGEPFYSEVV